MKHLVDQNSFRSNDIINLIESFVDSGLDVVISSYINISSMRKKNQFGDWAVDINEIKSIWNLEKDNNQLSEFIHTNGIDNNDKFNTQYTLDRINYLKKEMKSYFGNEIIQIISFYYFIKHSVWNSPHQIDDNIIPLSDDGFMVSHCLGLSSRYGDQKRSLSSYWEITIDCGKNDKNLVSTSKKVIDWASQIEKRVEGTVRLYPKEYCYTLCIFHC